MTMSDETAAMSCVIKDDAEAGNIQASIWNSSGTEGSNTQPTIQSHDRVSQKYCVAEAPLVTAASPL